MTTPATSISTRVSRKASLFTAAYENYLRLAPNGSLAPAVQSILEQLKSQQPE